MTWPLLYLVALFVLYLVPPAGMVLLVLVAVCQLHERRTKPKPQCWQKDEETGLEDLEPCKCFERMGNDFYFLPANECLFNKERCKWPKAK